MHPAFLMFDATGVNAITNGGDVLCIGPGEQLQRLKQEVLLRFGSMSKMLRLGPAHMQGMELLNRRVRWSFAGLELGGNYQLCSKAVRERRSTAATTLSFQPALIVHCVETGEAVSVVGKACRRSAATLNSVSQERAYKGCARPTFTGEEPAMTVRTSAGVGQLLGGLIF